MVEPKSTLFKMRLKNLILKALGIWKGEFYQCLRIFDSINRRFFFLLLANIY